MTERQALLLVSLLLLVGCGAGRPYVANHDGTTVLYTSPSEVNRLCRSAPGANTSATFAGCYIPGAHLAIVPHGDHEALIHELRHARDGAWHQ